MNQSVRHPLAGRVNALLIMTLLVVGALSIAPRGQAAEPPEFWGITSAAGTWASEGGWDGLEATGAETFRAQFNWAALPAPGRPANVTLCDWAISHSGTATTAGSYNFAPMDNVVRRATVRGMRVLPYLYGNSCGDPQEFPQYGDPEYEPWLRFVRDVVTRYGYGGTFWSENPSIPARPLNAWEIWNEPNLSANDPEGTGVIPQLYAKLLIDAAAKVRAAQNALRPSALNNINVLFGGFSTIGDGVTSLDTYLDSMISNRVYTYPPGPTLSYSTADLLASFDGLSLHPYAFGGPNSPLDYTDAIRHVTDARSTLNRVGGSDKPIWITEMGWPVGADWNVSAGQQSTYLSRAFQFFENNWVANKLRLVTWYFFRDTAGGAWYNKAGLKDANGFNRPSWCSYVNFSNETTCPEKPYVLTSPDIDRDPATGDSMVSYEDENQGVSYWFWSNLSGWISKRLGGSVALGTSPTVSRDPTTGRATIVYRTTNGQIGIWAKAKHGASWTQQTLGSAGTISANTSPAISRSGTGSGLTNVLVYRNASGHVGYWTESPSAGWVGPYDLGGNVAVETSPAVTRELPDGVTRIVFHNTSGQIGLIAWTPPVLNWTSATLGAAGSLAPGSSPDVSRDPSNGAIVIPYRNSSDQVAAWSLAAGSYFWANTNSGATISDGSNPTVTVDEVHHQTQVTFRNPSNGLSMWTRSSAGVWATPVVRGGQIAYGSNPVAMITHSGGFDDTLVVYFDQTGGIANLKMGSWHGTLLGWGNSTW